MSRSSPESVTVPIEPTREMWAAMANAVIGKTSVHHDVVVEAVYRAMVTSAPAAGHAQTPAALAALEPFARAADGAATVRHPDDFLIWQEVTVGDLRRAKAALSDTSTDRPPPAEPDYRDVVRKWFELRTSQQREIAASLGLPPQGTATGIEWGKLILTTAKDKGELSRVAAEISHALSDSSPVDKGA